MAPALLTPTSGTEYRSSSFELAGAPGVICTPVVGPGLLLRDFVARREDFSNPDKFPGSIWPQASGFGPPWALPVQGSCLSPILGNIYLHHALDRWFEGEVRPRLKGRAAMVRLVWALGAGDRPPATR